MLVTTFAVSFVLQSVALLTVREVQPDRRARLDGGLAQRGDDSIDGVDVRKVTIVSVVVAAAALGLLALLLGRTTIGTAYARCGGRLPTARLLGVSANHVIGFAVLSPASSPPPLR